MRIDSLEIQNYRGVERMDVKFHPRLCVFAGINGSGKSSILDCLSTMLSQCRALTTDSIQIETHHIRNSANSFSGRLACIQSSGWYILSELTYSQDSIVSKYYENRSGRFGDVIEERPLLAKRDAIANSSDLTESFPVVVYYPTNRAILDVPERIRGFRPAANQLDALEGALWSNLDFRSFIARFRESESTIAESSYTQSLLDEISEQQDTLYKHRKWHKKQVSSIRKAIETIVPQFSNLHVEQRPFRVTIEKNSRKLDILQLSDGEKCLVALLGDLAQRLAIANPSMEDPLEGEGIVLIDEIDLHLHPTWQRMIIPKLLNVFPNCQFIISTHSPQVLGEVDAGSVYLLDYDTNGTIRYTNPVQAIGLDSSELLQQLMGTESRNAKVTKSLNNIFEHIDEGDFRESERLIKELQAITHGDIPELIKANNMIFLPKKA